MTEHLGSGYLKGLVNVVVISIPARDVGVAYVLGRTLADGGPAVVLAESAGATGGAGAGVELAVGVGVARIASTTFADGRPAAAKETNVRWSQCPLQCTIAKLCRANLK